MTCTMAEHAGNDLMTYTSKLKNYIHRLTAAGVHLAEGKKMRVLLNGLDQDIFEAFIAATNRHPYASFVVLDSALMAVASTEKILAKLRALQPGRPASILATQTSQIRRQIHRNLRF